MLVDLVHGYPVFSYSFPTFNFYYTCPRSTLALFTSAVLSTVSCATPFPINLSLHLFMMLSYSVLHVSDLELETL